MLGVIHIFVIFTCIYSVQSFSLTVLHNNDFHSHFAPINQWGNPCDDDLSKSKAEKVCYGGAPRTIAKVKYNVHES